MVSFCRSCLQCAIRIRVVPYLRKPFLFSSITTTLSLLVLSNLSETLKLRQKANKRVPRLTLILPQAVLAAERKDLVTGSTSSDF